jgi:hypothetical protein
MCYQQKILSWRYSGFSVHNQVKIPASDSNALSALVQYLIRSPLSQDKIITTPSLDKIIYHSKLNPTLRRNFEVFDPLDWIAAVTAHIPNKGQQMVRYYGFYSNAARGKRKKLSPLPESSQIQQLDPSGSKQYRKRLIPTDS